MQYPLCRHIHTAGTQCGSPALAKRDLCFFHQRLFERHKVFRHTEETAGYLIPGKHLELAPLEDRTSVQMALSVVINALAVGHLEPKRATALLYGLQLASMNIAPPRRSQDSVPRFVRETLETPEGFELAQPGNFTEEDEDESPQATLPPDCGSTQ